MPVILENAKQIAVKEFHGLMTAAEETKLPSGYSPNLANIWTDESPGSVQTAKGFSLVGSAPTSNPIAFQFNYRKDDGTQLVLVSDNQKVWTTRDFSSFTEIISGLNNDFQLRAVAVRGKVWLTNGSDAVRTYDGTTVVVLDGTSSTPNVPRGKLIIYYHERVFMGNISGARASMRFTSLADSAGVEIAPDNAAAWPAINEQKVGDGDGEFLTGLRVFRTKLHMAKSTSWWRLEGNDEFSYFPVRTNATVGPRFQECIRELDGLLHYVGLHGVYEFDGNISTRVSDVLNAQVPGAAFSIANLQQSEVNSRFWLQSTAVEFGAGTPTRNVSTNTGGVQLEPVDSEQADFQAGVTLTNIDTTTIPGTILLTHTSSGTSAVNIALGQSVSTAPSAGASVGSSGYLTDGSLSGNAGFTNGGAGAQGQFHISVPAVPVTTIILRTLAPSFNDPCKVTFFNNGTPLTPSSATGSGAIIGNSITYSKGAPRDSVVTFPVFTSTLISILMQGGGGLPVSLPNTITMAEVEVYSTAYSPTGTFISRTLDYGVVPTSFGTFLADQATPAGTAVAYYTQSSSDGVSWDTAVDVPIGGAIASTVRRYLRWRVDFSSNGNYTPGVTIAYVGGLYRSVIHEVTDSILTWKSLEATYNNQGGTIRFFYRTATSSAGIPAVAWTEISPGTDITSPITDHFVQFKIELAMGDITREPYVDDVTINWIAGVAGAVTSNQVVHAITWEGRYWFDAAEMGFVSNNVVVIRGRLDYDRPWFLKRGWNILSFLIFNDSLYAGSSVDGKIYRLDEGFSLAGAPMDSYFETGDLLGDTAEYQNQLYQVDLDYEKMGDAATWPLTVGVSTNQGATWDERAVTLTGTGRLKHSINIMKRGYHFRIRLRTNGIDFPWIVHGVFAYYRPTLLR